MTPLEAIEKQESFSRITATVDGVRLWSNGHILVPADYAGEEKYSAGKLWCAHLKREGEVALSLGRCIVSDGIGAFSRVYRRLESPSLSLWIDEAYRQVCQMDGAIPYGVEKDKAIAFRFNGHLVSLCMPTKEIPWADGVAPCDPTDEKIWAAYACEKNGWYGQSIPALRERWTRQIQELRSDILRAKEEIDELKIDLTAIEARLAGLPE